MLRVAVPAPVRGAFDYLWEGPGPPPTRGARVRVPFGRRSRVGVCLGPAAVAAVAPERLRAVAELIDPEPVLPASALGLLEWAAEYYHHPVGEVVLQSLPADLRAGRSPTVAREPAWRLSAEGRAAPEEAIRRAPRQVSLRGLLREHPAGLTRTALAQQASPGWQAALRALRERGWVEPAPTPDAPRPAAPDEPAPVLRPAQAEAVGSVSDALGAFRTFLLQGVTGSGKTEVYLRVIEAVLRSGRQALVLVPEIGLTPQTVDRFRRRLPVPVAVLHSGLPERERLRAWLQARDGQAPVLVGTRSAVFVPLLRPGVVIVDEEHDLSYKQQEGFRYSARDVAVARGQRESVPVLLGSATPSLESLHNVALGRYQRLDLPERAAGAGEAALAVVDLRRRRLRHGLSEPLLAAVAGRLTRGEQVLLFLNRRGFAPTLLCHECGWLALCGRCDARMTLHRRAGLLRCHHCGAELPSPERCPACRCEDLRPIGSGTERVEVALGEAFPTARIARIDRDAVRRKGALEAALRRVTSGESDILIGTQMLAKGHHFPNVTLVGVIDADGGLFSADFRAGERLAQRILQVAGRAGRGDRPGEVLIQTHHPEHPLLRSLLTEGYGAFAARLLAERREAGLPPYAAAALLRAEAVDEAAALAFLGEARDLLPPQTAADPVQPLGPAPSPMERRAGRHRAQLLLLSRGRPALHRL
ncbi:MAG: primosomal protein N', partial [Gammaproteobacteria bacterium]|nr:primosomal protein N' [Gammaproteobacteria bacterium]